MEPSIMAEQEPIQPSQSEESSTEYAKIYVEAHPDAVVDPDRAEHMAYAGRKYEEDVAQNRKQALDYIVASSGKGYETDATLLDVADNKATVAEKAREDANVVEDRAADVYDRVKKL